NESTATVNGTVNPQGASVKVSLQFGTTTAYGQATAQQSSGVSNSATPFSAELTGLPAGTTIHYRAVATSDFGTFVGADQTLTTIAHAPPAPPAPPGTTAIGHARAFGKAKVTGSTASVRVSCEGATGATCRLAVKITATETFRHHRLVAVTAGSSGRRSHRVVVLGTASVSLKAGQTQTVRVALNRTGRQLLARRHELKAKLIVAQATATAAAATVSSQTVTFKRAGKRHARRTH